MTPVSGPRRSATVVDARIIASDSAASFAGQARGTP
jgi:hypothetical protein